MQTLAWAKKQGFKPVPLRFKSKAAINDKFIDPKYDPTDEPWNTKELGIGIVTGPQQSGPVDVDIDCEEAAFFAAKFLPQTSAVFGRKSKPKSHYLYRVEVEEFGKKSFIDPITRSTIIELRGDGGHQTVFPGSVHETTGELVEWTETPFPEVQNTNDEALTFAVRKVAIAVLVARHMWHEGQRNEIVKHLAGLLFYLEWPEGEVHTLVQAVMEYTGDDDKTRLRTVQATFEKGEKGGKITGSNTLRLLLGDGRIVDRILEWAGSQASAVLQDYNERFAIVTVRGKFRIAETTGIEKGEPPTLFAKEDFVNLMETDKVEVDGKNVLKARLWLANPRRRTYRSMDFLPGVEDSSPILNLWTGWAIQPDPTKSCRCWLDLLYYTICGGNDDAFTWMINWFANILREPMNKTLTCPVIVGRQGAGKSLLLSYFGRLLGPGYMVVTNEEHVYGRFNRHLSTTLLLHSEEALYGGDKKHRGIIKSLITDEFRIFEQKGVDAERVKNFMRLVLTSNEAHAAPTEIQDRRFTVLDLQDRKISPEAAKEVMLEMRDGGPAALFHHLLNGIKYDPILPRTNLKNDALARMKKINFSPVAAWWYDTLNSGQILPDYLQWAQRPSHEDWPVMVSSKALTVAFQLRCREKNYKYAIDDVAFSFQLNNMLNVKLERAQRRFVNPCSDNAPREVSLMQTKQYTILNMPPLEHAKKAFVNFMGQPLEWDKEEDEEANEGPKF